MIRMPGKTWSGPLPELTAEESDLAGRLERDVTELAVRIGERNLNKPEAYRKAADFIEKRFGEAGFQTARHSFEVKEGTFENLEVEIPGSDEILVVGAHYDSLLFNIGM